MSTAKRRRGAGCERYVTEAETVAVLHLVRWVGVVRGAGWNDARRWVRSPPYYTAIHYPSPDLAHEAAARLARLLWGDACPTVRGESWAADRDPPAELRR